MSGKLFWNSTTKKYEVASVKPPVVKESEPVDSIALDFDEERSGDEGDYKYSEAELDKLMTSYAEPVNAKKRRTIIEDSEDEEEEAQNKKCALNDRLVYLLKHIRSIEAAQTIVQRHTKLAKVMIKDIAKNY